MLESLSSSNVGARNAEFVLKFLQTEKFQWWPRICSIPIRARFTTSRMPVACWYAKLHRAYNDTLFNREKEYKSRIEHSKVEGDIELFTLIGHAG